MTTDRVIRETEMTNAEPTVKTDLEILEELEAEFPANQLKTLRGFSYIPEPIVRQRLRDVLGLNWNWEIVKETETVFKGKDAVVVTGRLTLKLPSGNVVTREAHGGSNLDNGMRAGDAFKSAGSNALKKAAYLIGIGAYLGLNSAEGVDDTTSWGSSNSGGFSNAPAGNAPAGGGWGGNTTAVAPNQTVNPPTAGTPVGNTGGGWGNNS